MDNKQQKKLKQDVARAEAAIAVLERAMDNPRYSEPLQMACGDEMVRLLVAIQKPKQLWRIYRRRDSGSAYA
jgi:hypothetical protein